MLPNPGAPGTRDAVRTSPHRAARVRRRALQALAAVICLVSGLESSGHKFYASLAQVERTPDNRLEASIRFFPDDLEKILSLRAARSIPVEDTTAFGAAFEAWFNAEFSFRSGKQVSRFKYVGIEVRVQSVWVHMEAPWTTPLEKSALANTMMLDLFPDQENTVNLVEGKRRSTLIFNRSKTTATDLLATPPARR